MRPLREKRQQYGGDPTIEIHRPEPVRVRHQEPAKISGKRTKLGDLLDKAVVRLMTQGAMPGYGTRDNRKPRDPVKVAQRIANKERQRARRKAYLEGVMLAEIPNE